MRRRPLIGNDNQAGALHPECRWRVREDATWTMPSLRSHPPGSGRSRALRTQLLAGRLKARKQFRIRLAQRPHFAFELTIDLGKKGVD